MHLGDPNILFFTVPLCLTIRPLQQPLDASMSVSLFSCFFGVCWLETQPTWPCLAPPPVTALTGHSAVFAFLYEACVHRAHLGRGLSSGVVGGARFHRLPGAQRAGAPSLPLCSVLAGGVQTSGAGYGHSWRHALQPRVSLLIFPCKPFLS